MFLCECTMLHHYLTKPPGKNHDGGELNHHQNADEKSLERIADNLADAQLAARMMYLSSSRWVIV